MEDPLGDMKSLIEAAIEECHDAELLDLVYRILKIENSTS